MAYVLGALLTRLRSRTTGDVAAPHSKAVVLSTADDLVLIPIGENVRAKVSIDDDDPILGFYYLTQGVARWAASISSGGPTAYVHAEFHGGAGFQAAVGWLGGEILYGPVFTTTHPSEAEASYEVVAPGQPMAIDRVLAWLGVETADARDEFEAVGLDRFRWTDDWAAAAN